MFKKRLKILILLIFIVFSVQKIVFGVADSEWYTGLKDEKADRDVGSSAQALCKKAAGKNIDKQQKIRIGDFDNREKSNSDLYSVKNFCNYITKNPYAFVQMPAKILLGQNVSKEGGEDSDNNSRNVVNGIHGFWRGSCVDPQHDGNGTNYKIFNIIDVDRYIER